MRTPLRHLFALSLATLAVPTAAATLFDAAIPAYADPLAAAVATPAPGALGPEYAARPGSSFEVGTLHVQVYGDHGRPVILIPGLAGGAWVWKDTIDDLRRDHQVYAVTLAGFDGTAAPVGDESYFDRADASLLQLIESKKLEKPVIIGHSLGGTLALRFAGEHSNKIAGAVAVDGLPVFPGLDAMSATQRQAFGANLAQRMGSLSDEDFKAQQLGYMQNKGVIDPALAARYAPFNARSDKQAVARYMAEDASGDWRPQLSKATVPVLEIVPYYAPDAQMGPMKATQEQKAAYYKGLLGGAPKANVVAIAPARHYVMLDQPAQLKKTLADFLHSL
ncbi:alpha/beta hydrolase [Pinirhizobacter sp.]|jgi:pimeloyl-ACP methyl ester carboxylesterase|uniref:alpha/beta fold hydrolase n=1 Tax=Pinirhizobacter sp. TaxID=2950432 RepID=UPI002F3F1DB2